MFFNNNEFITKKLDKNLGRPAHQRLMQHVSAITQSSLKGTLMYLLEDGYMQ